jgi:TPR repeat protein
MRQRFKFAAALLALSLLPTAPWAAEIQGVLQWPGRPPDSPETVAAFEKAKAGDGSEMLRLAEAGHADAQIYASTLLIFGAGVPKDGARGCTLAARAAATRADAMHIVGECYQYGYGGEKNPEKAIAAFHKAGDMGSPKSRCAEGNVLFDLGRDEAHAFQLCLEGAQAGDADAQTDVGNFYLEGHHVAKDVAAARGWYEKAVASSQQRNAAFVLGQIYWNGDGVAKDNAKAAELWRIAYQGGRKDASRLLGNEALVRALAVKSQVDTTALKQAADWYQIAVDLPEPNPGRAAAAKSLQVVRNLQGVIDRQKR